MMKRTDAHCHLQDYPEAETEKLIAELKARGFANLVCASTTEQSWQRVAGLARKYPDKIVPAFGIHPWYLNTVSKEWKKNLEAYLQAFPAAWIGECGLDFLKVPTAGQQEVFEAQIALAKEFARPLVVHALKAEAQLSALLPQLPKRTVFHSFGGSLPFLDKALKAGVYISLSAAVLRRKTGAEIIKAVPIERLLTETDAPYLSTYDDFENLLAKIAKIKEISLEALGKQVYHNFEEVCRGK